MVPAWLVEMIANLEQQVAHAKEVADAAGEAAETARRAACAPIAIYGNLLETLADLKKTAEWYKTGGRR